MVEWGKIDKLYDNKKPYYMTRDEYLKLMSELTLIRNEVKEMRREFKRVLEKKDG